MLIKPIRRAPIGGLGLALTSPAIVRAAGGWLPLARGAWTPASVTTAFWYDASNSGSITQSGGIVSQWNDLSGNARHLAQATTALQPAYTASALNSLPGIHFINNNSTTTNSMMATATFTVAQPFTVVTVFKNGSGGAIPLREETQHSISFSMVILPKQHHPA